MVEEVVNIVRRGLMLLNITFFIYRFATSVRHREILFQNDGYTSKGTARLRVNEFGVFYVFVATDWYDRVGNYVLSENPLVVEIFAACK